MTRRRRGGRPASSVGQPVTRDVNYRQLRNPFPSMDVFSADEIQNMHETALRMLEEMGMKVLLPEARKLFAAGGAKVDEGAQMVHIGREMVEAALATAPKSIPCRAGDRKRDFVLELGSLVFQAGAGAPYATDLERGRRAGSAADYIDYLKLTHHFDVLQMISPQVEPQDVDNHLRHYFTTHAQMTHTDKFPFIFSRGTPQVMDCFEMIRDFRGLSDDDFRAGPHCYTIINTNSPRTLDIPMAQGADRLCPLWADVDCDAVYPDGGDGTDYRGGIDHTQPRRGAGRDCADTAHQPRCARVLRHLYLQRRYQIRRTGVWHTSAFSGVFGRWTARPAHWFAVAIGGGFCVQRERRTGGE